MPGPFKDNTFYNFFVGYMKDGEYRGNPAIKFTFGCVENDEDTWEVMSTKKPIVGSRIHKLMQVLGYKDVEGKEPDPSAYIRRGMMFSAKVVATYSEGKTEKQRYRINFETIKPAVRTFSNNNSAEAKWVKDYVGDIKTYTGISTKLRNTSPFPNFEQLGTICDMIRSGELDLQ